jgi:CBS domain-containing protein
MRKERTKDEALTSLVAATVRNQHEGEPVHRWPLAQAADDETAKLGYQRVEEFMTTDLFTVHEDEPLDLVANLMDWKRVRHIPVEDEEGKLVGLISCFEVLRQFQRTVSQADHKPVAVSSIMIKDPLTVTPETATLEAIALLRRAQVDCLPVVKEGRLVGIVTERDFINVAARLLEQRSQSDGANLFVTAVTA